MNSRETDLSAPEIPLVKADEEHVPVHLWVDVPFLLFIMFFQFKGLWFRVVLFVQGSNLPMKVFGSETAGSLGFL